MSTVDGQFRQGISIVCVYNNPQVLRDCLKRSIAAHEGANIEFIPIDNQSHAFSSAGAALNDGTRRARHDIVVFAHQDVYIHSIDRLMAAAHWLRRGDWGLLGANGMTNTRRSVGRMRDRVKLIGEHAPLPVEVDSLDEVLIMARRDTVLEHPISEDPRLAWHAYAVEEGLRLRRLGMRVAALDLGITHNSLTINLENLDVAHRFVGETYMEMLPIRTTCGSVGSVHSKLREWPFVREHRWRTTWLRQSIQAMKARRVIDARFVLGDIGHDVDRLGYSNESPLHVINIDGAGGFTEYASEPLEFSRSGRRVTMQAVRHALDLGAALHGLDSTSRILVTDVALQDLAVVARIADRKWVVGLQPGAVWLLSGPDVGALPGDWTHPKATPLMIPGQ